MKTIFLICSLFCIAVSCGVVGKPLAPLEPELMGYGLPEYDGDAVDEDETKSKKKTPEAP